MRARSVNEYLSKNNILFPTILDETKKLFYKTHCVQGPSIEYINDRYIIKYESSREYRNLDDLLKAIVDVQKHDTDVEWNIEDGGFLSTPKVTFISKEKRKNEVELDKRYKDRTGNYTGE
jgi:hypothetical protein